MHSMNYKTASIEFWVIATETVWSKLGVHLELMSIILILKYYFKITVSLSYWNSNLKTVSVFLSFDKLSTDYDFLNLFYLFISGYIQLMSALQLLKTEDISSQKNPPHAIETKQYWKYHNP